ncbi:MAG: hypothetical protein PHH09_13945, partial [Methanoregulaceae archaeon]|nr:hypothetical protein [Methanoregulaceae archaeon]
MPQIHKQTNELELWTSRGQDDQFNLPKQIRWLAGISKLGIVIQATIPDTKRAGWRNPDLSYSTKFRLTGNDHHGIDGDLSHMYLLANNVFKISYGLSIISSMGTTLGTRMIDASGDNSNVYFTSNNATDGHGVRKVRKSDMAVVASLLATGSGNGQFSNPLGVFYYDDGAAHVYICDTDNNRIVKLLASDLSFVANISLAYSPLDLCTDGVNWYVQSATTLYKYDMSFTDGTKASTAITGYSITIVPDQSDGNGQTIAISDNANHRLHRVKCSDLSLIMTIGSNGDGSSTLVPLRVDFPAQYAGTARWEFSDGEIIPAVSGAAISWNGFTGYTPRAAGARAVLKGVPLSALTRLDANSTGLVGDITNLRPDRFRAMQSLYLQSTSVSGDISGWVLPSTMQYLSLFSTSVSGDISGWVLPSSMRDLFLYSTSVSGDISGWVLPSSMQYLRIYSTFVRVLAPFAGVGSGMKDFQIQNCSLPVGDVDNVIESIWDARLGFIWDTPFLNVGGTNAAPGGTVAAPPGGGESNSDWYWDGAKYIPLTAGAMI